jgi:hypothetical protein
VDSPISKSRLMDPTPVRRHVDELTLEFPAIKNRAMRALAGREFPASQKMPNNPQAGESPAGYSC